MPFYFDNKTLQNLLTSKLFNAIIMTTKLVKGEIYMDDNEILEKSRLENKNKDLYEQEVIKEGGNTGAVVAGVLATIFFIIQILVGKGINYSLYAVIFCISATGFTVKAYKLKRKHEIIVAILYWIIVILFSVAHIYNLISTSTVF